MPADNYIPALRFNWLTPIYDPLVKLTTRENAFKNALVEQSNVKEGQSVLDLACGTGTLAILLKQATQGAEITGMDGDRTVLERAKKKADSAALSIKFDQGLSYKLPYNDESFDRVISSLFFHHLTRENKLKTFDEVRRVLNRAANFMSPTGGNLRTCQ